VSSIEKEEIKSSEKTEVSFLKKQHVAWKEESRRKRGKKREKSFTAVVRVLYRKEEGAWVSTVAEYCLSANYCC
jgi:hypothetical protein